MGMAKFWFHCGLAFFSRILVQTWKTKTSDLNVLMLQTNKMEILEKLYRFASKVDFHHWIHQVLPVGIKPKDLPHPVHEGVVHYWKKQTLGFCLIRRQIRDMAETNFVAGLQLWRSSEKRRLLSERDRQVSAGFPQCPPFPQPTHVYLPGNTDQFIDELFQYNFHKNTRKIPRTCWVDANVFSIVKLNAK